MDFFEKNSFPKRPDLALERRINQNAVITLLVKYKGCIIGFGASGGHGLQAIYDGLDKLQIPLVYTYGFFFVLGTDHVYYRSNFGETEKGIKIDSIEELEYYIGLVIQKIENIQEQKKHEIENKVNNRVFKGSESHRIMIEQLEKLLDEANISKQFDPIQLKLDIGHLKEALNSSIELYNSMTFKYYFRLYFPNKY
jgi:hypothetical protein